MKIVSNIEEKVAKQKESVDSIQIILKDANEKIRKEQNILPIYKKRKNQGIVTLITFFVLLGLSVWVALTPSVCGPIAQFLRYSGENPESILQVIVNLLWVCCLIIRAAISRVDNDHDFPFWTFYLHIVLAVAVPGASIFIPEFNNAITGVLFGSCLYMVPATTVTAIRKMCEYIGSFRWCNSKIKEQQERKRTNEKKLDEAQKNLDEYLQTLNKAKLLFKQGENEQNDDLLEQAAQLGYKKAEKYLSEKRTRKLAQESEAAAQEILKYDTISDSDKSELERLAKLNSISANLYLGKEWLEKGLCDEYTNSEKHSFIKRAKEYFKATLNYKNIEGEILYMITLEINDEYADDVDFYAMLARVRHIKQNKLLPDNYPYNIDYLIERLIERINDSEEEEQRAQERKNTVIIDDDFLKRADAEYNRMLGRSTEPEGVWVDINTGLPL